MKIMGIDFTSQPTAKKRITCLHCTLADHVLRTDRLEGWSSFAEFENALLDPGPWIAGIDFPFGQARTFIENMAWPLDWAGYVTHVAGLSRDEFCSKLDGYSASRPTGARKLHRRKTDQAASSISPQKLHFTPVGLMFFRGAPHLLRSGVTIPMLQSGDPKRVVVEAYPALLQRHLIGRKSYKHDQPKHQNESRKSARKEILNYILSGRTEADYGFRVEASQPLADDPTGDELDSLLCSIQAAWAWTKKDSNYGAPPWADPIEGWIADPKVFRAPLPAADI